MHNTLDRELTTWPHQERAIRGIWESFDRQESPVCCVAPPGAGKSYVMRDVIREAMDRGLLVAVYIHRIQLLLQVIAQLESEGIPFGVRAASHERRYGDDTAPIQICSLRTEASRLANPSRIGWLLPDADLVLVDEYHQQCNESGRRVFLGSDEGYLGHLGLGAHIVGFTATPVGLRGMCTQLINAGDYSEMRAVGAHDIVRCYGLEEPDLEALARIKKMRSGEYSSRDMEKLFRVPTIFGNVYENWKKLNAGGLPTLLYSPTSAAARYFVAEFAREGVSAASISHDGVCIAKRNGAGVIEQKEYELNDSSRKAVIDLSRSGEVKIVCNRFILREAIDMPWIYCGILATKFGAVSSYLQSVGRIQRAYPDYGHAILLDHGGNYSEFLSPNLDRIWEIGDTDLSLAGKPNIKDKPPEEQEPICCPRCSGFRVAGDTCPHCGYRHRMSVVTVRQVNGELKTLQGGRQKRCKARVKTSLDYLKSAIYAQWHSGGTVGQAYGWACVTAKRDGCNFNHSELKGFYLPRKSDPEWKQSVREVYHYMRPRHMRQEAMVS